MFNFLNDARGHVFANSYHNQFGTWIYIYKYVILRAVRVVNMKRCAGSHIYAFVSRIFWDFDIDA